MHPYLSADIAAAHVADLMREAAARCCSVAARHPVVDRLPRHRAAGRRALHGPRGRRRPAARLTPAHAGRCRPVDLDEVADELYALPPDEFIPARKAREDEAKADGDKALAKEINALPKPSTAAWVCNLLVREARDEIAGAGGARRLWSARRRRAWPVTSSGPSTSSGASWSPHSPARRGSSPTSTGTR